MKRKLTEAHRVDGRTRPGRPDADAAEPHPPPRQRQPQTSCDFCRLKKLKCDRASPCSTCVTRGRPCAGPPVPLTTTNTSPGGQVKPVAAPPELGSSILRSQFGSGSHDAPQDAQHSVLQRLRRLEEAVFGDSASRRDEPVTNYSPATRGGAQSTPSGRTSSSESEQPDYATACDSISSKPADYHNINFRFAQSSRLTGTSSEDLTDELPEHATLQAVPRTIWLPSKEGMSELLNDYVHGQHLFLGIIDPYATRQLIDRVYSDLPHRKAPVLSHIALLLAIAATSAFFWDKDDGRLEYHFSSVFDAANWSVFWRNSAWDVLDQLRREVTGSLEELQATCILAHLISQIEGCPSRYRRLQGNAITIAREISLHVIDAPKAFLPWDRHLENEAELDRSQVHDTEAVREVKRRVWWHLTGTDWLLSVMGGPLYKSYTINPLHMNVRYPRNINDGDLQNLTPWPKDASRQWPDTTKDPPTTYTYSLLRLRVAEICYKIVDALQPIAYTSLAQNGDGVDQLPYDEILRISRLFDDVLASFPASYALDAPIPPGAPADLDLQRQVLLLYFHARRARVFRPFLRSSSNTSTREPRIGTGGGLQHRELGYDLFAYLCRDSARTVLRIACSLVNRAMPRARSGASDSQHQGQRPRMVHRCGLILMHLFMACVILATDPTLSPNNPNPAPDTAERRKELSEGCYVLKMAGQRSSLASGLMETLTVVLNRHKLRVFCNNSGPGNEPPARNASINGQGAGVESGHPQLIRGFSQQDFATSTTGPHQNQELDNTTSAQAITGSFIATDDDREAVNDVWGIDRMQARILAEHTRNKKQRTSSTVNNQPREPEGEQSQSAAHQLSTGAFEAVHSPLPATSQLLPLDGLWKDLLDAASGPSWDGNASQNTVFDGPGPTENWDNAMHWDHLFADLEYFVGP
ncbi:hypothetical protein V8F20_007952 [Naviculisporaceae sp. PSN 640]